MSMEFRDPRVIGGPGVVWNALNAIPAAEDATSTPEADQDSQSQGYPTTPANTNFLNQIPAPPETREWGAANVGQPVAEPPTIVYPTDKAVTNVTYGPDYRDEALDRSKGLTGTNEPTGPIDPVESAVLKRAPVGTGPKVAD